MLSLLHKFMEYIVEKQIWILMIIIAPLSVIYDIIFYLLNQLIVLFPSRKIIHEDKVKDVQRQVKERLRKKDSRKMCTARPQWKSISLQKMNYKDECYKIHVNMDDIISLDEKRQRVLVEPMVSIGQLNDYLIQLGWTLPVVPELDDLTIGGLVMGGGIESTSHKYGLFQYICTLYEIVLADGSVVKATEYENEELFCATPFSYGTLGFLTAIELNIIPYKPYLKLTYSPIYSLSSLVEKFTEVTNDSSVDSVEGILYSLDTGVIMHGQFVTESEVEKNKIYHLGSWHTEWFYTYVEKILLDKKDKVDYIPTKDFFHRHNKSWFWLLKHILPHANTWVFRWIFGWAMPPKYSFLKFLRQTFATPNVLNNFICQDFGFQLHQLQEALSFIHEKTEILPIWLCPTRHIIPSHLTHLSLFNKDDVHVDIGIYGFCEKKNFDGVQTQKDLEKYAITNEGYVALYAETQLSREDFFTMFGFNLQTYENMRQKLNCENAFPHVYEKISKLGRS